MALLDTHFKNTKATFQELLKSLEELQLASQNAKKKNTELKAKVNNFDEVVSKKVLEIEQVIEKLSEVIE